MRWIVLADEKQQKEFIGKGIDPSVEIEWISNPSGFDGHEDADAFFDLLFENTVERKKILSRIKQKPVIVHSVTHTLEEISPAFYRINAWPGFLHRDLIEICGLPGKAIELIGDSWKRELKWVPDEPGFIAARIIAMIINEAYLSLAEKISSREEIDTAMKLGTNYPFGPFEWSKRIGARNIHELLSALAKKHERYRPAGLLTQEAKID